MTVYVQRYKRRVHIMDPESQQLYYLKQVPGSHKLYNIRTVAKRIEKVGALSAEDVYHVVNAFVRELKEVLVEGDKVKVDELGIFSLSINVEGSEMEEDCTVKKIRKVNIRFRPDSKLRLVNDATATTRGGENNVAFEIRTGMMAVPGGDGDDDDDWEPIPDA